MLPALCGKFTTGGRYNSIISRNDAGYVTDILWHVTNISRNDTRDVTDILWHVTNISRRDVSNGWIGIWNGTMEWKMEWNSERSQLYT